jgi:hypothetical protein
MPRSQKLMFIKKRLSIQDAQAEVWPMIFSSALSTFLFWLALIVLTTPNSALAHVVRMDENDPKIHEPRGEMFLDVTRSLESEVVRLTVEPVIDYWSQGFGCPDGEKPIGYQISGTMLIKTPGGLFYYETGDSSPGGEIEFAGGEQDWHVAGLMRGSEFSLGCPSRDGVVSTRYLGIDRKNSDGLIEMPRCETDGRREVCYVLGLKFKSKLAKEGSIPEHSIEGHQDLVRRYNESISQQNQSTAFVEEERPLQPIEQQKALDEPAKSKQIANPSKPIERTSSRGRLPYFGVFMLLIGMLGITVFARK